MKLSIVLLSLLLALCCAAEEVNVFPEGGFENTSQQYRPIGDAKGSIDYDGEIKASGRHSLKITNRSGGNLRGYLEQAIVLEQRTPKPIKVSYACRRQGNGKTLATIDLVIIDADGKRTYWFDGLKVDSDTGGQWVQRENVYKPAKPVKSIEVWPIVNGDPCTVWFDDVSLVTELQEAGKKAETFSLSSGDMKVVFSCDGANVGADSISFEGNEFISKSAIRSIRNLWSIDFQLPDRKCVTADTGKFAGSKQLDANHWRLEWRGIAIPDSEKTFDVDVLAALEADGIIWHIDVKSGEDILKVTFPRFNGIGPLGEDNTDDFLAMPENSGKLYQNYSTVGTINKIYGAGASMQCAAFYDANYGMYLASHDSGMLAKLYSVAKQLDNSLSYSLETMPDGAIAGRRSYSQPFPFVMKFFHGDWFDAAQIYRSWALEQPWCRDCGKLSARPNDTLFDCDVWVKGGGVDEEGYSYPENSIPAIAKYSPEGRLRLAGKISSHGSGDRLLAIKNAVSPAGVSVFFSDNWHCFGNIGICAGNPEYQARRGFSELVSFMNANNVRIVPYTNFGRWDLTMAGYREDMMIHGADMSVLTYPAHNTNQGAVCHVTEFSEELWRRLARQVSGYGCPGIYLDELSTNGNPVCYANGHGHEPGDGSAKIHAQRKTLLEMKAAVQKENPDFYTMGEQGSETYIGANDVNMWWLVSTGDADIPFYDAVYHDYSICMGRIPGKWYGRHVEPHYKNKSGEADLEEFALAIGKCLVSGLQLGIVRDDIVAYSKTATEILSNAARLRHELRPYLLLGQMMRAPEVLHPLDKVDVRQGFANFVTTPSAPILSNAFQAENGKIAAVFFNITGAAQKAFWEIAPVAQWGLAEGNYSLSEYGADGWKELGVVAVVSGRSLVFEMPMKPYACQAIVWPHTDAAATPGLGEAIPPASGVSITAVPRRTTIKAGDSFFIDCAIKNKSENDATYELRWNLPEGMEAVDLPSKLQAKAGKNVNAVAEVTSRRDMAGKCQLSLDVIDIKGEKAAAFTWDFEYRAPRPNFAANAISADALAKMRECQWQDATDTIRLVMPRRKYPLLENITPEGIAAYDAHGLYFLFRVNGVATPVKAPHSDSIWHGCCMQFALNGARLNQSYDISICLADTANGKSVFDFMGNAMLKNPDFNFRSDDKAIYYFYGIPWRELGFQKPPVGKRISFSATYNHNDGRDFAGYLEWTPGICGGTDKNEYGDIVLVP